MLEPFGHDQAAVRQQSVIAERDPHAVERHAENGQGHAGPAKEPGNERGQGRQMDRHDRDDVEPDDPVKTNGGRQRQTGRCLVFDAVAAARRSKFRHGSRRGSWLKLMKDRSHQSE